jgi:rod shape determining protein RodA
VKSRSIFEFDLILPLSVTALMTIGILFIYSSGISSTGINMSNEYIKQIFWASIGLLMLVLFNFIDYSKLKNLSKYFYFLLLLILLLTLMFGQVVKGSRAWLGIGPFGGQPSEFSKVATILFLAKYLEDSQKSQNSLLRFIIALGIGFFPMGLILLQPDLGTAMVFVPLVLMMVFLAGLPLRYIAFVTFTGLMAIFLTVLPAWEEFILGYSVRALQFLINPDLLIITILASFIILVLSLGGYIFIKKRYYYWITYTVSIFMLSLAGAFLGGKVLKDYQLKRLIVFIDPSVDPQGAGWNVIQSITAVGSGGGVGKGFLKGTQSHYRFLPEQSTDFIFSIIAEEWGFLGCSVIFILFLVIMLRSLYILNTAKDKFGLYMGGGVLAVIFFHFIINVGMAMGIMPITGIPLLFLSYGGSALWSALLGIALIMNVYSHRYKY